MDGVFFMKKIVKWISAVICLLVLFLAGSFLADKYILHQQVLRMHVVANSDSAFDQDVKLSVRDAILDCLRSQKITFTSKEAVCRFVTENEELLLEAANRVLFQADAPYSARISLKEEAFDTRTYDTFTLPSGIYTALRVELGEAKGKNWWCVVFPDLCVPASGESFQDVAAAAGFDAELADAVSGEGYTVRFYFLELLGRIEKYFFK